MTIRRYKYTFVAIGLIVTMVFASAALGSLITIPGNPQYSEIYILGPSGQASNLPFNIAEDKQYKFLLGVGNHMDNTQYYVVDIKVRNQTQPFSDETAGSPSLLPTLYQYRTFVDRGKTWQTTVTFSVSNFSLKINSSSLQSLKIGNSTVNVDLHATWDEHNSGFYYQMFFELWSINPDSGTIQYQNRYVYLWMNVTSTPQVAHFK